MRHECLKGTRNSIHPNTTISTKPTHFYAQCVYHLLPTSCHKGPTNEEFYVNLWYSIIKGFGGVGWPKIVFSPFKILATPRIINTENMFTISTSFYKLSKISFPELIFTNLISFFPSSFYPLLNPEGLRALVPQQLGSNISKCPYQLLQGLLLQNTTDLCRPHMDIEVELQIKVYSDIKSHSSGG